MKRLDIRITIIQKIQNFVEFRPLKAELLLRQSSSSGAHLHQSVRKVFVCGLLGKTQLAQSRGVLNINKFLKAEVFCNYIQFCLIFSFCFNDHFLLFILASVAANHKTAIESDVLNKIAGVLKYAHDKIGAGVGEG